MADLRDVVHSRRFERDLRKAERRIAAREETLGLLEWTLARAPERGMPLEVDSGLHIWPIYIGNREWVVFYKYDEERVHLEGLREGPENVW